jgi:hypothetical protein
MTDVNNTRPVLWEVPGKRVAGPIPLAIRPISWSLPTQPLSVPPEGVKRLRANYAGEASNVDYWFGKILETAGELDLLRVRSPR